MTVISILLALASPSCKQSAKVELGRGKRDIVASFRSNLPLQTVRTDSVLTNRFDCLWDLKREENGIYYYVENREENWRFITRFFEQLYQTKPRIHSNAGSTNESIYYGVGVVPFTSGILRVPDNHAGSNTNVFCVVVDYAK